ncbi:nonribosomal peptide synthase GliP-like protein [Periconia macrospinosa]|uniref:Nonribosomal peptide synthase GliP-like protein n=1 Tax=Periconia macrospinosa TaxID=97972 RepID=A0A2V1DWC8_9PLEO|nr:nonribosomal peptide synthase GliP-like protein [Periconia macrospinosa]
MCEFCDHLSSQHACLNEISIALNTSLSFLDLKANFLQNGGDSLASIQLQAAFRRYGVLVAFEDIFVAKTLLDLAESLTAKAKSMCRCVESMKRRNSLKRPFSAIGVSNIPNKQRHRSVCELLPSTNALFATINTLFYTQSESEEIKEGQDEVDKFPMTEMQLALVHSTIKNPSRNVISHFETHRTELLPLVKQTWMRVISTEPIFRMKFEIDESGGSMCRGTKTPFNWNETFVPDEAALKEALDRPESFDSLAGTRFDAFICHGKIVLMWRVHHAYIDGVSFTLLKERFDCLLAGEPTKPAPSFAAFASQLQSLQKNANKTTSAFWDRKRTQVPSPATRPLFPPLQNAAQASNESALGSLAVIYDSKKLIKYCRRVGVTMASLYYAAWGMVLSRFADSGNVSFGVVLSGRTLPIEGAECVIGSTINTLPFQISIDLSSTVKKYTRYVFESLLELTSYEWSTPGHGFSRDFESAVNVQLASTSTRSSEIESKVSTNIPIHIEVESGHIRICYDTTSFSRSNIEQLRVSYSAALEAVTNPDLIIEDALDGLIGRSQRAELARMGNWGSFSTRIESVQDDLVSLFARAAEVNPSEVAIEHYTGNMTYAQLHERSSLAAGHLSQFIVPGDIVCVHADGTPNWVVAIYAVLKAGATYCPFAPELPETVRATNYETSKAKLFLTGNIAAKKTKPTPAKNCLSIEDLLQQDCVATFRPGVPSPHSNAYLCFTSGSTGKPKGVLCKHLGLVAFQRTFNVRLCAQPGWKISQFMSPGFDGSIHEIFSALSYGATLVLKDPSQPFSHLKAADAAILTPSVAKSLSPCDLPNLKALYLVGEAVPQHVCDIWAQKARVFNMYGPTEATCGATIKELKFQEPVTLGTPNPSTRIYILDSQRRLAPPGVVGEVYLAGIQVAVGYVGLQDITAQRFLPDTVNAQYVSEKMYKTGDRAFWTHSGELALLGRSDREIKLRGFRIDLDDLEIRMARADRNCTAAAVTLQNDYIVAMVQPAHINLVNLREKLLHNIPAYALPRHILAVESFPTTPVGKLDYKAIANTEFAEPRVIIEATETQEVIISALRSLLHAPSSDVYDPDTSFSELGLDSILQLFLSHRLSRSLKRRVPLRMLLESSTIRQLVHTIDSFQARQETMDDTALGDTGVSPIEREWWQKYEKTSDTSSFNVTYACKLPEFHSHTQLANAWNTVLSQHRILRCKYQNSPSTGLLRTYSREPPKVRQIERLDIITESNTPFDIANDDLVRVIISPTEMLVVISHIICDLTTLQILLREVFDLYQGKTTGSPVKTYAQTSWSLPAPPTHLSFWSEWLADSPVNQLSHYTSTTRKTLAGTSHFRTVPTATYKKMISFGATNKISMHQMALSAVALALQYDKDTCDIVIGAPYLNRNSEEDQDVVGLFLEPFPIRIQYPQPRNSHLIQSLLQPETSQDDFVHAVKRCSRVALSYVIPFDQLLSHLSVQSNSLDHRFFDVMVTFHDVSHEIRFPIEGVEFIPTATEGAKFKLMAEFTARTNSALSLRLEYSKECFSSQDISIMSRMILMALEEVATGNSYEAIVQSLRLAKVAWEKSTLK